MNIYTLPTSTDTPTIFFVGIKGLLFLRLLFFFLLTSIISKWFFLTILSALSPEPRSYNFFGPRSSAAFQVGTRGGNRSADRVTTGGAHVRMCDSSKDAFNNVYGGGAAAVVDRADFQSNTTLYYIIIYTIHYTTTFTVYFQK